MHVLMTILLYMGISITLALAGLHWVRKKFPHPIRQANNEVAGFFMAVLGVMYAVLLAFVIIVVWQEFEDTRLTVEKESNALAALYRLTVTLPEAEGTRLRGQLREYAQTMVDDEWPAMAVGRTSTQSVEIADQLWLSIAKRQTGSDDDRLIQTEILQRLNDLNDNRRLREMEAGSGLPPVMWVLLIGGAIVSIVFTYFFSTPNPKAQYAMTSLYVASIVFVLVLVGLLDFPFAGDVHVSAEGFERALVTFDRLDRQQSVVKAQGDAGAQVSQASVGR
jgi:uncharacterized protein DUF4239